MRLLICAGGTGGGVYPALSVLQTLQGEGWKVGKLKDDQPKTSTTNLQLETLWVGGEGGIEADLVKRAGVPFEAVPAAGLHGVGLRALPGNLVKLAQGARAARRILRRFRPEVLFFTGGYVAAPVALAGRDLPSLLYVPDIEPGLALKGLARFSRCIALTAEASKAFFPKHSNITVTGYPVRPELHGWSRESAFQTLGLDRGLPVLLVFGGSKGARSLNRALLAALPGLLERAQVIHISGTLDWPEVQAAQAGLEELAARYHPYPYLHEEMGAALAASDLVVSRAGASVLGEFPLFGLPAVLVPYPYAWRYQQVNAQYLAGQGAAIILPDAELPERLLPLVLDLLGDPARLEGMRAVMRSLAQPQAAHAIAELLVKLALGAPERRDEALWLA